MADRTQAAQDILLDSHEARLDGLNGIYVPQLQAYVNRLDDWAQGVYRLLQARSVPVKPPPTHLVFDTTP
jgi:hypothetical protein